MNCYQHIFANEQGSSGFLPWASRNSSKPGRNPDIEHLVIHAGPEWTAKHWEHNANEVAEMMLVEFWKASGISPKPKVHLQSHRWKYAIPLEPSGVGCFSDESAVIVACGGSRVEGAFLSGMNPWHTFARSK